MRHGHRTIVACAAFLACGMVPASGTETGTPVPSHASIPADRAGVDAALAHLDPKVVAAARHYYDTPEMRARMSGMVEGLVPAILASVESRSAKPLDPDARAKLGGMVQASFAENYGYVLDAEALLLLQVLDAEQVVALDAFYSTPSGRAILSRMPDVASRTPEVIAGFMPPFMASLEARMKAADIR